MDGVIKMPADCENRCYDPELMAKITEMARQIYKDTVAKLKVEGINLSEMVDSDSILLSNPESTD